MEECPCVLRCLKSEDRPRHDTTPELMSAIVSSGVVSCRGRSRSEEHTSELQSHHDLVCRLLLEKKKAVHLSDNHLEKEMHCGKCHLRQDAHGKDTVDNDPRAAIANARGDGPGSRRTLDNPLNAV